MNEPWKDLLKISLEILDGAAIGQDSWTMGGGTVLMLHFNHRRSKDIDIFFHDAQYITHLSPRLNDITLQYTSDYDEQSNFLKLRFESGEIDCIVAPRLTQTEPETISIDNLTVRVEQPEEIVIKKIFYRAESLKVRDLIDLAVVIKHRKDSLLAHADVFSDRLWTVTRRIELIRADFESIAQKLDIIDSGLINETLPVVQSFLEECLK